LRSRHCQTRTPVAQIDLHHRDRRTVKIANALIAATAQVHQARLVTRNARHFPMLDNLLVPYQ
jgi:predicted nucleic acid-binding protein